MRIIVPRRANPLILGLMTALAVLGAGQSARAAAMAGAAKPGAAKPWPVTTSADFCAGVQQQLAATHLPVSNQIHADFASFVASKPAIQPLTTHQYVQYDDDARTRPLLISCKTKSVDHIAAVYGNSSMQPGARALNCQDMNRRTIMSVWNNLDDAQRRGAKRPPQQILLDVDDVRYLGSSWLKPYPFAYTGADGRLHVWAKAQHADWNDWRWKFMPSRFRGTAYCHLIAPEYARRLMLGEAQAPPGGGAT
jgi:hypothetical protein